MTLVLFNCRCLLWTWGFGLREFNKGPRIVGGRLSIWNDKIIGLRAVGWKEFELRWEGGRVFTD
jgi:hypothetical protein